MRVPVYAARKLGTKKAFTSEAGRESEKNA
jgi:hypothetical protein